MFRTLGFFDTKVHVLSLLTLATLFLTLIYCVAPCQCGRHGFAPGQEGRSEQETAFHASILAGTNPWTEEPGRLQPMGSHSQTTEHTAAFYSLALPQHSGPSSVQFSHSVMFDSL